MKSYGDHWPPHQYILPVLLKHKIYEKLVEHPPFSLSSVHMIKAKDKSANICIFYEGTNILSALHKWMAFTRSLGYRGAFLLSCVGHLRDCSLSQIQTPLVEIITGYFRGIIIPPSSSPSSSRTTTLLPAWVLSNFVLIKWIVESFEMKFLSLSSCQHKCPHTYWRVSFSLSAKGHSLLLFVV